MATDVIHGDHPLTLTLDTTVWWDWLSRNSRSCAATDQILNWHAQGHLQVHTSSRVRDPDMGRGLGTRWNQLETELTARGIPIDGAPFRIGVSRIGWRDPIGSALTHRTPEELARFRDLIGPDPTSLHSSQVGKRMPNKIGDYDALKTHFARGHDVFLTLDTVDYFAIEKREQYRHELGLVIQTPAQFVSLRDR